MVISKKSNSINKNIWNAGRNCASKTIFLNWINEDMKFDSGEFHLID